MKKMILFLFAVTIATAATAQTDQPSEITAKDPIVVGKSFACPDGSVFSQIPTEINNGYYCQEGHTYYMVASSYVASGPFSSFRLWGLDHMGCTMSGTEPFDVYIWDGNPANGGNLIFFETLNGITLNTQETAYSSQVYQIDIALGSVINQPSGYIGITRKNATCDSGFAWSGNLNGTSNRLSYNGSTWTTGNNDLFFCLSGEPSAVPIKNWTIYLTALLIGVFLFIGVRKVL